jgi:hypothetical protein
MDHPNPVTSSNSSANAEGNVNCFLDSHGTVLRKPFAQARAVEKFHHDEWVFPLETKVVNLHDVLTVERAYRLGLSRKTLQHIRVENVQNLHGDVPLQNQIPRPVHVSHAALADQFPDLVAFKLRASS